MLMYEIPRLSKSPLDWQRQVGKAVVDVTALSSSAPEEDMGYGWTQSLIRSSCLLLSIAS